MQQPGSHWVLEAAQPTGQAELGLWALLAQGPWQVPLGASASSAVSRDDSRICPGGWYKERVGSENGTWQAVNTR